ncbi:alpha-galactosidase [Microbacterium terrae]|uniref:alpha-galactosidase n=1 Tax=Microbacterium terrae TaxID=69369 RepID=A0A0M2HFP7_9MICO|nr:alpha-galactosidase [Microbacterium terrae]KJL45492.1 Alpha-galactosidase [Microbacterium terrae]MBP1078455.1 alpha-galactosidase [Microbacterium terrae]GLJ99355.1 alpha-galactosidase [Microbacterium terrae]
MTTTDVIQLEADGLSVVLDPRGAGLPTVLHWGASVGRLDAAALGALADAVGRQSAPGTLDAPWQVSLAPAESDAWSGRPGLQLRRAGVQLHVRWTRVEIEASDAACTVTAMDEATGLVGTWRLAIERGVLWAEGSLSHGGAAGSPPIEVEWFELTMPVPSSTDHLLAFDGRWTREKRPVIIGMPAGSTVRQSRRGRPGHDAPTFFLASEGAPTWRAGRTWGVHAAWPSDVTYRVDRVTDSVTLLGAGEMLRPGEVVLAPGDVYSTPRIAFVHTEEGLDGIAARFHTWLRGRAQHPSSPRPLTLNTWEAVYFDHDPARVTALADLAAELGIERFVLDDGWFAARRDDTTGLGDWTVDRTVWPDGLAPLAARVHDLGMQFGLWFEPEMISVDSDLYRAHPDWLLHDPRHLEHDAGLSWRTQYVLDLAQPGAFAHVLGQMDALVTELGIDYIKWDHNRDLVESVHDGRPGVHGHTLATLELMRALKLRHPSLEIESCSSGGARTDLGVLEVTDRVWASDSNDPVERQDIQKWTGLLLPPELVGAHVGPGESHSSGRVTPLSYRMATSLMGSAGFEWDILTCTDDESATISAFAQLYRELRPIVHRGVTVHPELRDPSWRVTGFIAPERDAAVVVVATIASLEDARPERLRIPGLDPGATYRVRVRREVGEAAHGWITPPWFTSAVELPGSVLEQVGLQLPTLWPVQAFVLHLERV